MSVFLSVVLAVVALSALGGWWLGLRKPAEKPVKAMLFVGYFWLLAFIQVLMIAGIYYIWQKY